MHPFQSRDVVFGDIPILRADRQACPVCGHPTGDCIPGDVDHRPKHIAFTDSTLETLKESQTILVEEDIYEDRQITPFTTARVITVHKGSYVTIERAKELGIF